MILNFEIWHRQKLEEHFKSSLLLCKYKSKTHLDTVNPRILMFSLLRCCLIVLDMVFISGAQLQPTIEEELKQKKRQLSSPLFGGRIYSIPCLGKFWIIGWIAPDEFFLFFKIILGKELNIFFPPKEATSFAFSSVLILL